MTRRIIRRLCNLHLFSPAFILHWIKGRPGAVSEQMQQRNEKAAIINVIDVMTTAARVLHTQAKAYGPEGIHCMPP